MVVPVRCQSGGPMSPSNGPLSKISLIDLKEHNHFIICLMNWGRGGRFKNFFLFYYSWVSSEPKKNKHYLASEYILKYTMNSRLGFCLGFMGDSYSNCLRLALAHGYEYYNVDPLTYVEVVVLHNLTSYLIIFLVLG